jgi:DNA topoisomerase-3
MRQTKYYRALNVAEKPSVAKGVTDLLYGVSRAQKVFKILTQLNSHSKYNPVYKFDMELNNDMYEMIFTSVRGHLMNYAFDDSCKQWVLETTESLFHENPHKVITQDCKELKTNLEQYARQVDTLILWLDCDREGENICFEVVDIVKNINSGVRILRAKFSALTKTDINRAIFNLEVPNKNVSDAVDIRQRIDLIIGASFTRFQTLLFKPVFNTQEKVPISYGPCQFPTLNFIVERTEKIRSFKPEEFYYIDLHINKIDGNNRSYDIQFDWERGRLFDKFISITLLEKVIEAKTGLIKNVASKDRTRLRPQPLNTVEMQKLISKKLKIRSHEAMELAEKLYQKGFISYPRTETQKFKNENLKKLVDEQRQSEQWGTYVVELLEGNY